MCTQPIDKRHFKPPVDSASIKSIDSLHRVHTDICEKNALPHL